MLTGAIKNQIDRIWDAFWSGGISNPLEVIEQITYLLFLRRLDDLQTLEENKANRLGRPIERHIFPQGNDPKDRPYAEADVREVKYILYDTTGTVVEIGSAEMLSEGQYQVTLPADTTSRLPNGSARLELAVVPVPVAVPSFTSLDFVALP